MKKYASYKSSGTQWLGDVPADWKISNISALYILRNEKVSDRDYQPLSVTMKGIVPQLESAAKTDAHDSRKLVCKGDFAINSRSDRRGSCGISEYDGSVSLINTVLTPRGEMNPRYYNWLFHTVQFADEYYKYGHGIVDDLWTTRWDDMKRILIPFPSIHEQSIIAEYLDKKVKQIENLISEAKASVEEYKMWKTSIIYEAVTHGLDPNVEMKNSGVEWIGKIPSCWEMMRIKDCAVFMPKVDFSSIRKDDMITFTPMDCIKNGYFENKGNVFSEIEGSYTPYAEGDIVFAKVTPCFENGNAAIMENLFSNVGLGSSELFVLRAKNIDIKYLFYFIRNKGFIQAATSTMTGTGGLKRVSSDFVKNAPIPILRKEEQKKISSYLDKQCKHIDDLVNEKEALISDLESYKKSLIFEVVTGKRRVC